ncbi:MAG: SMC-Scp complex subunit ScpB [Deltaproteobacteria bacterium]|nr:SMC-Scp complex subunit ScpB [Deltaproteobacteria bacterium]MCL5791548.1 SMC-Scp complex subunit ScpB [Deltaproteobacteria bacterium]
MNKERIIGIIEALIFASNKPLKIKYVEQVLSIIAIKGLKVDELIQELKKKYDDESSGIELVFVADGWQFRTKPSLSEWVKKLTIVKPSKLSTPALETLAIVSYRQPVTRAEIEYIRGVDSGGVVKTLLERGLIKIVGKKELPGRPMVYGTTQEFLEVFGLKDLSELPNLEDLKQINSREQELEKKQEILPLSMNENTEKE